MQLNSDGPDLQPTCPRCKSAMCRRTAKVGKHAGHAFWGCSKFPVCKGIVSDSTTSTSAQVKKCMPRVHPSSVLTGEHSLAALMAARKKDAW